MIGAFLNRAQQLLICGSKIAIIRRLKTGIGEVVEILRLPQLILSREKIEFSYHTYDQPAAILSNQALMIVSSSFP